MEENLEGKTHESVLGELDAETLERREKARLKYREKYRPLIEAIRESEMLTGWDYSIRITI